jgi:hypothetical protein
MSIDYFVIFLDVDDVVRIHEMVIERYGGVQEFIVLSYLSQL